MTALLGRSQITAANDRKEEVVEIPEWGGSVRILTIVGPERVACVGVVSTREYTSKTGEQRSVLEMLCSEVELLGGRGRDGGAGSHESSQRSAKSDDPFTDDLPFCPR